MNDESWGIPFYLVLALFGALGLAHNVCILLP